jgi:hypothetical protein
MSSQSHNAKKPKLAVQTHGKVPDPALADGTAQPQPGKHKLSFAQHQHEQQIARTEQPLPAVAAPAPHLKSDAQQHQQKAGSRR